MLGQITLIDMLKIHDYLLRLEHKSDQVNEAIKKLENSICETICDMKMIKAS